MRFPFIMAPEGDNGGGGGGGATILSQGAATATTTTTQPNQQSGDAGQPPQFDFRAQLDDQGNFKPGWHGALPDDLKPHSESIGKYPNPLEMMRGLANAQKLIGQRKEIKPPGPEAKPEEIAAWRKTIGVPEAATIEAYGIKAPEKLPEGVSWDEEAAKGFTTKAHELGLTPAQVQGLIAYDVERQGGAFGKSKAAIEAHVAAQREMLTKEWGDKFEENKARAMKTAQLLGIDPTDAEIGNSAKLIKALHAASSLIQEDKLLASDKVGLGLTGPAQAEDIMRNPANPWNAAYWGKQGKEKQMEAQALIQRLNGVKMPA